MRAAIAKVVLVIGLLGWAAWVQPWAPRVYLLTGDVHCYASATTGQLVADPESGTTVVFEEGGAHSAQRVMWPAGYTARRVGSGVEVLGWLGNVVAVTGSRYVLIGSTEEGGAFGACGAGLVVGGLS
jgi:hypothetical protein